jgi:hypothetical protein
MLNLMLEGGFPMFFLLAFGLVDLFFAARFARAPSHRRLRVTVSMGLATGFTTLTATCTDVAAVGHHAPDYLRAHAGTTMPEVLLQGLGESMSPGILGFTTLSLVALIVVVGQYREPLG